MKHNWKIKPRGKKPKYYISERCGLKVAGWNKKQVDKDNPICHGGKK